MSKSRRSNPRYARVEELIGKTVIRVEEGGKEVICKVAGIAEGVGFTLVDATTNQKVTCYNGPLSKEFDGHLDVFNREFAAAVEMLEHGVVFLEELRRVAGPGAPGYSYGPFSSVQSCAFG